MRSESASPARLAWLRLRANRLAMLGLAVVVVVALATLLSPWLGLHDPERRADWLGACPPGFSQPDCAASNGFRLGAPAAAPSRLRAARRIELLSEELERADYRILLDRNTGVVAKIAKLTPLSEVTRLELTPPAVHAVVLLPGEIEGPALAGTLVTGELPPAGWFAAGDRVLLLRLVRPQAAYVIDLVDGVPSAITRDGVAVDAAEIRGVDVRRVIADGRELTLRHPLGTDQSGRDLLSRVLWGGRVSLLVGVVATVVSLVIGVLFGAIAGYVGGRTERAMMGAVDVLYAVPFMFLVILLLTLVEQRSLLLLFVALGAVQWLTMARIVRGQVRSLAHREFIAAARMSGASHARIIGRHLIPNCLGPVIVYATLTVPAVILQESFLSFLGLGVGFAGRHIDSWGALVNEGAKATQHPWLLLVPATLMAATLLALNALGDGLRDAFDPRGEMA